MDIFQTVATAVDLAVKARNYLDGVKKAPRERDDLRKQCSDVFFLLTGLRDLLNTCKASDPWYAELERLCRTDGPVDHLRGKVSDLVGKICRKGGQGQFKRISERLAWPFSTDEVLRLRGEIHTILTMINAELNMIQM
jgi:hypothetical protein